MSLADIGAKYGANKPAGVFRWYEGLFINLDRDIPNVPWDLPPNYAMLELGVKEGYSLRTWRDYFGPRMHVHGLDIDLGQISSPLPKDGIETGFVDQSSRESLEGATKGRSYDVIIDDGSHICSHQQLTLGYLFSKLKPGGLYIIEDLHTSQWGNRLAKEFHTGCTGPDDMTLAFLERLIQRKCASRFMLPGELKLLDTAVLDVSVNTCCFHKSAYRRSWKASTQACIWKKVAV